MAGEKDAVVEFDYDGVVPSRFGTSLSDSPVHPIGVKAVDFFGNVRYTQFTLFDVSIRHSLIATLEGYSLTPTSLSFSPDGTTLASVASGGTKVKLWNVATQTNIVTLEGHIGTVLSVVFSPDGTMLASASGDGTVKLWDVVTSTNIATLEHTSSVQSVSFSPDGATLAMASGFSVSLWNVATQANITTLEHTSEVLSVMFSPDGTMLASGLADGTVKLWDVVTSTDIATLEGHTVECLSLVFSPDGTMLASGSYDGTVKLWDTSKWLRPRLTALSKVSGDNQQGTSGSELTSPLIIELRDQYGSVLPLQGVPVTFTITAGDGQFNGKFTVENKMTDANGRAQTTLTLGPVAGTNTVEVSGTGLKPVTFNAVGIGTPEVPITSGDHQTWYLPDGAMVRLGKGKIGYSDRAIAFSPDGQYLAVASGIGIWLYDVATYRELALIPRHMTEDTFVAFSPDGTLLALGTYQGSAELWDVSTRTKIATLEMYRSWDVISAAFSPDGTLLTLGIYGGSIELWDVLTRTKIATFEGHTR